MIKSLGITLAVLAIANLLAIGGFVGWLAATDRLSPQRVQALREMFAKTNAEDAKEAAIKLAAAEEEQAKAKRAEESGVGQTPLTAEQRLQLAAGRDELAAQHHQRIQRETSDLLRTLLDQRTELDKQRAEHMAEVKAFEEMRKAIAESEGSEQFQKAVALYQSLKPEQSQPMMLTLIRGGQTEQVVSYLNALPARLSAKIIGQFQKTDPGLAASLLERLRTRGSAVADAPIPEG